MEEVQRCKMSDDPIGDLFDEYARKHPEQKRRARRRLARELGLPEDAPKEAIRKACHHEGGPPGGRIPADAPREEMHKAYLHQGPAGDAIQDARWALEAMPPLEYLLS